MSIWQTICTIGTLKADVSSKIILKKEKRYVHNIFTTNSNWQVVTGCYCWGKKVILVIGSNLNQ